MIKPSVLTFLLLWASLSARQVPGTYPAPVHAPETVAAPVCTSQQVVCTTEAVVPLPTASSVYMVPVQSNSRVLPDLKKLSDHMLTVPRLVHKGVRSNVQKMQQEQNSFEDAILLVGAAAMLLAGVFYLGHLIFPYSLGMEVLAQVALAVGCGLLGVYIY